MSCGLSKALIHRADEFRLEGTAVNVPNAKASLVYLDDRWGLKGGSALVTFDTEVETDSLVGSCTAVCLLEGILAALPGYCLRGDGGNAVSWVGTPWDVLADVHR